MVSDSKVFFGPQGFDFMYSTRSFSFLTLRLVDWEESVNCLKVLLTSCKFGFTVTREAPLCLGPGELRVYALA